MNQYCPTCLESLIGMLFCLVGGIIIGYSWVKSKQQEKCE